MDKWDAAVQEYAAGMEARIRSASEEEALETVWQLRAEASDGRWRVFLVSGSSSLFHLAKTLGRGFAVDAGGLFTHSQVAGSLPPGWLWCDDKDAPLPHLKAAAAQKQATVALTFGGASFPAATLLAQCGGLSLRVVAHGAAPRAKTCVYPLLPRCAGAGRGRGAGGDVDALNAAFLGARTPRAGWFPRDTSQADVDAAHWKHCREPLFLLAPEGQLARNSGRLVANQVCGEWSAVKCPKAPKKATADKKRKASG
jgi:hypothetical protein